MVRLKTRDACSTSPETALSPAPRRGTLWTGSTGGTRTLEANLAAYTLRQVYQYGKAVREPYSGNRRIYR